eukprot:Pgem_evm1s18570
MLKINFQMTGDECKEEFTYPIKTFKLKQDRKATLWKKRYTRFLTFFFPVVPLIWAWCCCILNFFIP